MTKDDAKEIGNFGQARITYIKLGKEVNIEYKIQHGDLVDLHVLKSADEPTVEFKAAFQELDDDVCEICELGEEERPRIKINGLSLEYKGEKNNMIMSAVISATRRLKRTNGSMHFDSPSLPEAPKVKKKPEPFETLNILPASAATQIYIIINEARKYLNGIRAQTSMTFPKTDAQQ
jgi:hypothetical protein